MNFNGTVVVTYKVCDPSGLCDTATLTITVSPVNDAPIATNSQGKDLRRASYYVDSADRYLKLFNLAMSGANAVELGDVNNAAVIARGIYTASKISSKFASAFVPGP